MRNKGTVNVVGHRDVMDVEKEIYAKIKMLFYMILMKVTKRKMIIDITGTVLTPRNLGKDCKGNGKHMDWKGRRIACCCDECNYMLCCLEGHSADACLQCTDTACPHTRK